MAISLALPSPFVFMKAISEIACEIESLIHVLTQLQSASHLLDGRESRVGGHFRL